MGFISNITLYTQHQETTRENNPQKWYQYISVEVTMFLYMFAFMITSVVEQTFYINKACRVNHGYSEDICNNLDSNRTIKEQVQVTLYIILYLRY